jgi:hypothetical protein
MLRSSPQPARLAGLGLVDVGQLLLEIVDVHRGSVARWRRFAMGVPKRSPDAAEVRRPIA